MNRIQIITAKYGPLEGKNWIVSLPQEAIDIIMELVRYHIDDPRENGRKGGNAVVEKYGNEHMARIGRKGAKALHNKIRSQYESD